MRTRVTFLISANVKYWRENLWTHVRWVAVFAYFEEISTIQIGNFGLFAKTVFFASSNNHQELDHDIKWEKRCIR